MCRKGSVRQFERPLLPDTMPAPTLLVYLVDGYLRPATATSWFGPPFVRVSRYLPIAQILYETGLLLGHTYRDRLDIFLPLVSGEEVTPRVLNQLRDSAAAQTGASAATINDLFDLFAKREIERLIEEFGRSRNTPDWREVRRIAKSKLSFPEGIKRAGEAAWKGLAVGSQLPDLADHLCGQSPDNETWAILRSGLPDLASKPPPPQPLLIRKAEVLNLIRPYVEMYHFDLLTALQLWTPETDSTALRFKALMAAHNHRIDKPSP